MAEKFKAGDTVEAVESYPGQFTKGRRYTVRKYSPGGVIFVEKDDKGSTANGWNACKFKLVTLPSPIRTVTRREIVPGVYGEVEVEKHDTFPESILIKICDVRGAFHTMDADELREAAHLFNQIAEVLEENAG